MAGTMMAASITVTGSALEPGPPTVLFPTRILGGGADIQLGRQHDVAGEWVQSRGVGRPVKLFEGDYVFSLGGRLFASILRTCPAC